MLPVQFLTLLADAQCSIRAWDPSRLQLAIEKEIGPETGILTFHGVSMVHLPPRFTVLAAASSKHEVPDFLGVRPAPDEWLYVFQEAGGRAFYVLAESAEYQVTR